MTQRSHAERRAVTAQDVLRICGHIDDAKMTAILETEPNYEELEEAAAWLADEEDPLRELERPLTGKAAIIFEILESDLQERENREKA